MQQTSRQNAQASFKTTQMNPSSNVSMTVMIVGLYALTMQNSCTQAFFHDNHSLLKNLRVIFARNCIKSPPKSSSMSS